jgi:hypothetical protein
LKGFLLQIDIAQIVMHEADEPNAVFDFPEADKLTCKRERCQHRTIRSCGLIGGRRPLEREGSGMDRSCHAARDQTDAYDLFVVDIGLTTRAISHWRGIGTLAFLRASPKHRRRRPRPATKSRYR